MGDRMSCVKRIGHIVVMAAVSSVAVWATQTSQTQDIESILASAKEAQARSDFSAAAGYYWQAVKIKPDIAELWVNLGLMDDLAGNSSDALTSFTQAAHLNGSLFVANFFSALKI